MQNKISALKDNEVIVIRFDNLPENFPLSFVYDIVEYSGGKWEDIEEAKVIDDFAAELTVMKDTAMKVAKYSCQYVVLRRITMIKESMWNCK